MKIGFDSEKYMQIQERFRPSESPDKELPIIFNVNGGGLIMGC